MFSEFLSHLFIVDLLLHGVHNYNSSNYSNYINNDDVSHVQLDGYRCIAQGNTCTSKGSLIMYVDTKYNCNIVMELNTYRHWEEGQLVNISGGELAKHILIGNIYRPPRTLLNEIEGFIEELTLIVQGLDKKTPNVLLAGDYNLNLLKVNELRTHSDFLDLLMLHNLYPQITVPTRFSKFNATLIDNFFCKLKNSGQQNIAGILIRKFSDHQPYFIIINKPQNREQILKFT